jgi:hypothetical protein
MTHILLGLQFVLSVPQTCIIFLFSASGESAEPEYDDGGFEEHYRNRRNGPVSSSPDSGSLSGTRPGRHFTAVAHVKCCDFFLHYLGVWIIFSWHSPNWRVVQYFYLPSQTTRVGERGKDPRQFGQWVCIYLLINSEFYSQLASWRVVICTPALLLWCMFSVATFFTLLLWCMFINPKVCWEVLFSYWKFSFLLFCCCLFIRFLTNYTSLYLNFLL